MVRIAVTAKQSAALKETLDGVIGGKCESSLLQVLELEEQHPGEFDLARQLHKAAKGQAVEIEVPDVAAAMRAIVGVIEYHDGGTKDTYGDLIDGPVCLESVPDYPERVRSAVAEIDQDARTRQLFLEVLAKLSLARAKELEYRPINQIEDVYGARLEFLGRAA